jgi:hypothetical protein
MVNLIIFSLVNSQTLMSSFFSILAKKIMSGVQVSSGPEVVTVAELIFKLKLHFIRWVLRIV